MSELFEALSLGFDASVQEDVLRPLDLETATG
jgi:hypothetical protein